MVPAVIASWPVAALAAAGSALAVSGLLILRLRRQVRAAWTETGRIYQRSTARLDAVGDLLDGVLFEANASLVVTYTNRAFQVLTGYRDRDLHCGLTLGDLVAPEDRTRLLQDLDRAGAGSGVRVHSYWLRCRDGATVPASLRLAASLERGRVAGWRGFFAPDPDAAAVSPDEIELVVSGGLAEIGRQLRADRCYHYESSADRTSLVSVRQWYAEGVSPLAGDQTLPALAQFPWLVARLRDEGAILVPDLRTLSAADVPELARWLDQGIASLMVVPVRRRGEVVGLLGCETLGRARSWGRRDRLILEAMAASERLPAETEVELLPEPMAVTDRDGRAWVQATIRDFGAGSLLHSCDITAARASLELEAHGAAAPLRAVARVGDLEGAQPVDGRYRGWPLALDRVTPGVEH